MINLQMIAGVTRKDTNFFPEEGAGRSDIFVILHIIYLSFIE